MFNNLLVPLDGSKLSEAALGPAAFLTQKLNASVMLLHVIEQDAPAEVHKEHHLTESHEADAYLREAAHRAFPPGIQVQTHVHTAPVTDVARSITEHAASEFNPGLIVICTHGRGGMRDLFFGSIAQQVVAQCQTPLLVIKPDAPPFNLDRILVPLDPDSVHDESVQIAESLAKDFDSELLLLNVIPTLSTVSGEQVATSSFMPSSTKEYLNLRQEEASEHLEGHVEEFHARGIKASAEVARGDPASVIVRTAERSGAGMLFLSTHRRVGMDAFWALSVAPEVAQKTKVPLLLIPLSRSK